MLKPKKLANNNFLSSLDLSTNEVFNILELANNFKNKKINIDINDKDLKYTKLHLLINPSLIGNYY